MRLKYPKLYKMYDNMKQRTSNKKNTSYSYYGGKGIAICASWHSVDAFIEWALQTGFKDGLSIDRIDGDKGYSPQNCRWVSKTVQNRNTKKIMNRNTSGFRGVSPRPSGAWQSRISVNNSQKYLGSFKCRREAAYAYDRYIEENKLEHTVNFLK